MADWRAPAQALEGDTESQGVPSSLQSPVILECPAGQVAEGSVWTLVAALQAVESKVDALTSRLLSLEGRMGMAEKKIFECEKTELEIGSQLEGKWTVLGTLFHDSGLLQRRLEKMEDLLKNRNFWVLRIPPRVHGETPKVPGTLDDNASFPQGEQEKMADWHKELYTNVLKGNCEYLISLDYATSKSDILSRIEQGEELEADSRENLGNASVAEGPRQKQLNQQRSAASALVPGSLVSILEVASSQVKQEQESLGQEEEKENPESKVAPVDSWLMHQKRSPEETEPHWTLAERSEENVYQDANSGHGLGQEWPQGFSERVLPGVPERDPGRPNGPHPQQSSPEWPYFCADCGRSFIRTENFARHRCSHQVGERPFSCRQCGKAFVHQSTLTSHYRTHTGEKPYGCAECEKRFSRLSTLVEHRRTHTGEKPYACAECEKCFGRLSTLVEHRRTHTGEKPYACTECEKRFTRLTNLTAHQNTHSGERAYSCTRCGKSFPQKAGFLKHLRAHAREKLHQCQDCAKSFTCRSWLLRHQMVHSSDLPKNHAAEHSSCCQVCDKAFGCQGSLKMHQRNHAEVEDSLRETYPNNQTPFVKREEVG